MRREQLVRTPSLRDAGLRTIVDVQPASTSTGANPDAAGQSSSAVLEARWQEVGQRLIAQHPPDDVRARATAAPVCAPAFQRAAIAPVPPPEVVVEYLELHVQAPSVQPAADLHTPGGAWSTSARRFVPRTP